MGKKASLRTQIFILMSIIVIIQSTVFYLSLNISGVYEKLDMEAVRLFRSSTKEKSSEIEKNIGILIKNIEYTTEDFTNMLQDLSLDTDIPMDDFYLYDDICEYVCVSSSIYLTNFLTNNNVTGAFMVLNGSNSNKDDPNSYNTIYIRNSSPNTQTTSSLLLEIGHVEISRRLKIPTSINWKLDFNHNKQDKDLYNYYNMPMKAAKNFKNSEIIRYGYWAKPVDLFNENQTIITYTLPILDENGDFHGVVGFEISLQYFVQNYLYSKNPPYDNSFVAITSISDFVMDLSFVIPGDPISKVYLQQEQKKALNKTNYEEFFSTNFDDLGNMYCYPLDIKMYSENSSFIDDVWTLVGFVPENTLHSTSNNIKYIMMTNIVLTTLFSSLAIFALTHFFTRKITGLSSYINTLSPENEIDFENTGLLEIDELVTALQNLNKKVIESSKKAERILSLSLLPIGGFEIQDGSDYVLLTNYIYELLKLDKNKIIRKDEWQEIYTRLCAKPLKNHENIYPFNNNGQEKWLRIVTADTDTGVTGIILDVTKDINENQRLSYEVKYDSLTKLYKRDYFKKKVNEKINSQPHLIGAMMFSDLDNLKYVNDSYGHLTGDELLKKAGDMFKKYIPYGAIVSRISGDEFAIYIHGYNSKEEIRNIYSKIYLENENSYIISPDGYKQKIRYSTGVAWYPFDSDNMSDLIKLADYAMYEVKHTQKGIIREFDKRTYEKNSYLLKNREALNTLLENEMIRFAFQPIVDIKTGQIFAYEALMRSTHSEIKSPLEIINLAKTQSKLKELENLTFKKSLEYVQNNIDKLNDKKIFINSIANQNLSNYVDKFIIQNYKDIFPNIVVEITEAESNDPRLMNEKINDIRSKGMQIAIDDFGSGYSNELRILSINPDIVKIDMALIQGIHENEDKKNLVKNLIDFCHSKNIRLIAEGVEVVEDLKTLIALNMDYVQGYYLAKPEFEFKDITEKQKKEILDINEDIKNI